MAKVLAQIPGPFLKKFDLFMVCAEAGSLVRAAERVAMQQSGLSKAIGQLEDDLGYKLFIRTPRGMRITSQGKVLFDALQATREKWLGLSHLLKQSVDVPSGIIRIGCHQAVAFENFKKFLPKLLQKFPDIEPKFEFATSPEITQKVARLEIDLGFVVNPVKSADLISKKIRSEFMAIWRGGKDHDEILLFNPEAWMSATILKKCAKYRLIELSNYDVIASLVRESRLAGLLPSPIAERYGLNQVSDTFATTQLSMIWHRSRINDSSMRKLIDEMLVAFPNPD